MGPVKVYALLVAAIVAEVIATTALKASDGFTRPWPSLVVVLGYGVAFYCLAIVMRVLPTGIVYAIWSGLGMVLVALLGWWVHREALDLAAIVGLGLILAGVIVINVFSRAVGH